jgi:Lar family restriction alleviation protein
MSSETAPLSAVRVEPVVSLRPCPFCGGSARLISDGGSGIGSCVACNKCHISTDDLDDDAAAAKLWNTRYVPEHHDV